MSHDWLFQADSALHRRAPLPLLAAFTQGLDRNHAVVLMSEARWGGPGKASKVRGTNSRFIILKGVT